MTCAITTDYRSRSRMSRPGVMAGAVLRAARRSARASTSALAAAAGVTKRTIRSWESGSYPLASAPAPDIQRLEAALGAQGADPRLVCDLGAAAWCDLIVCAIADDDDIRCLLADPITGERGFRELLSWSLTGQTPARYQPYRAPSPAIANPALIGRAFHSLAAVHPALAADCVLAPVPDSPAPRPDRRRRRTVHGQHAARPHLRRYRTGQKPHPAPIAANDRAGRSTHC